MSGGRYAGAFAPEMALNTPETADPYVDAPSEYHRRQKRRNR